MDYFLQAAVALFVTASAIAIFHLVSFRAQKSCPAPANKLPPGSLGLPVIGQTLGVARAMRGNSFDEWTRHRFRRYGPVSKLSLFWTPTVLLRGPEANKFVFFNSALRPRQMDSFRRVIGDRSIIDLHGDDHRRIRGALMEFLKPDKIGRAHV